jgi:hypothetical protein
MMMPTAGIEVLCSGAIGNEHDGIRYGQNGAEPSRWMMRAKSKGHVGSLDGSGGVVEGT